MEHLSGRIEKHKINYKTHLLATIGCLTSVALASCTSPDASNPIGACGPDGAPIAIGPFVGEVAQSEAKIWVRGCEGEDISVEYRQANQDWSHSKTTGKKRVSEKTDDTVVIPIEKLQPQSIYGYRIKINGTLPSPEIFGEFKTLPKDGAPSKLRFAMGTDLHFPWFSGSPILDSMAAQKPDFAFFIGDNVVVDQALESPYPNKSQADYEALYQKSWQDPAFQKLRRNTGTFMEWDDHDIFNDWSSQTDIPYPYARAAYNEYVNSANPDTRTPGGTNYLVKAGDVEFYLLDTRTFRSNNMLPDGPNKTMLGKLQKEDVENWLETSHAKFKFLISSVWWNDFSRHAATGEPWASFKTERDEIFNFISSKKIAGVVLISGDEHSTAISKLSPSGLYELTPGPLNWAVDTPQKDPGILYKSGWRSHFAIITTDTTQTPATLKFELKEKDGKNAYTLNLTENDLVPK